MKRIMLSILIITIISLAGCFGNSHRYKVREGTYSSDSISVEARLMDSSIVLITNIEITLIEISSTEFNKLEGINVIKDWSKDGKGNTFKIDFKMMIDNQSVSFSLIQESRPDNEPEKYGYLFGENSIQFGIKNINIYVYEDYLSVRFQQKSIDLYGVEPE